MTWTRTPQEYPDRADVLAVSRSARWLLMEMYSWSNAQLTNGRVPRSVLRRISDAVDVDADVAELLREGLLEEPEEGFLVLDWTNQESADTVAARSARNAEKTKRARERKERHLAGDHSICVAPYCKLGQPLTVTGNATSKDEGNATGKPKGKDGTVTGKRTGMLTPLQSSPFHTVRSKGMDKDRAGADSAGAPSVPAAAGPLNAEGGADDPLTYLVGERRERYLAALADLEEARAAEAAGGADHADTLDGLVPADAQ